MTFSWFGKIHLVQSNNALETVSNYWEHLSIELLIVRRLMRILVIHERQSVGVVDKGAQFQSMSREDRVQDIFKNKNQSSSIGATPFFESNRN